MMQVLKSIRDFMNQETLKWLPGNIQSRVCTLLKESLSDTKTENGVTHHSNFRTVLHVFDEGGTLIGTIEHPHYIPSK